ncbi:MAG: ribosome biogenesis GTP-binding protein YihA/YsxC [Oscillospiraceae bacterium]
MIIKKANFLTSYGMTSQLPPSEKKEIVMAGRSNVGKSSLINKMCNRKSLARVSSAPGKTGTINFYEADDFHLVDLPGYGFAKVSDSEKMRWSKLINGYFESKRSISLVVQLLDCRHEPSKDDQTMLNYLTHHKIDFIIALTKGDKLNKTQMEQAVTSFKEYCKEYSYKEIILTSTEKNIGIEHLTDVIGGYLVKDNVI